MYSDRKVIALIVTFNPDIILLEQQLISLIDQIDSIIYIDNGSINYSDIIDMISKYDSYPINIKAIGKNIGLAAAQNLGIKFAMNNFCSHVLILDHDTILDRNVVEVLSDLENEKRNQGNKIALVAPVYINTSDNNKKSNGVILKGLGFNFVKVHDITEVDFCISSGSLISIGAFNDIGLMDENLFIDGVDFEWCMRAKYKGYKIIQTSRATIFHALGVPSKNNITSHSPFREYYICRNSFRILRYKHMPFLFKVRKFFLTPLRILINLFCGRYSYFKAGMKGLFDVKF